MRKLWVGTLQRTPKWILFLIAAGLYASYSVGQRLLTGEPVRPGHVVGAVLAGLVVVTVGFWLIRWQGRRESKRPSGSLTATNLERALASGRPPVDAVADEWVPKLHKAIRTDRIMAWAGPLLFGAFTVLGIYLTVTNPQYPWFWVLSTIAFAGIAVWYPIWVRRRRVQLERLINNFTPSGEHAGGIQ